MILESVFRKIDFANRYKKICEDHNNFDNSMRGNNKRMYLNKLKSIDDSVVYFSKDKMFKVCFEHKDSSLDLGLQLNDGLIEARLFYIKSEEWLLYNRFDFICAELDSEFNRKEYDLPKYGSESELEDVLREIFLIYEDIKKEVLAMQ